MRNTFLWANYVWTPTPICDWNLETQMSILGSGEQFGLVGGSIFIIFILYIYTNLH